MPAGCDHEPSRGEARGAAVGLEEVIVTAAAIGLPTPRHRGRASRRDRLAGLPLDRNFREIVLLAPGATPSFYGTTSTGTG